jgi:hypothetical protein
MDTSSKVMAKGGDKDYARKRKSEILSTKQNYDVAYHSCVNEVH